MKLVLVFPRISQWQIKHRAKKGNILCIFFTILIASGYVPSPAVFNVLMPFSLIGNDAIWFSISTWTLTGGDAQNLSPLLQRPSTHLFTQQFVSLVVWRFANCGVEFSGQIQSSPHKNMIGYADFLKPLAVTRTECWIHHSSAGLMTNM